MGASPRTTRPPLRQASPRVPRVPRVRWVPWVGWVPWVPALPGAFKRWWWPSPHDADISAGVPGLRIPACASTAMAASPAYGEEKGGSSSLGEPEYGHDPASGGIFASDYKRWGWGGDGRGDTLGTMAAGWWCPPPWDGDVALDKDGDASLFAKATGMWRRFEGKKMGFGAGMGGRKGERSEICCGMEGLQVPVPPTHGGAWGA